MTDEELLALSGLFYEGIMSPACWRQALHRLTQSTASGAASILLLDRRSSQLIVSDQVGLPDELLHGYATHYHELDPARDFVDRVAFGKWYLDERDLGAERIRRSPFYQDFLCRYELDSTISTRFLPAQSGLDGFLTISDKSGKRDSAKLAGALSKLIPHLQRAGQLRMKLQDLSQQLEVHSHALDRFRFPLLVVNVNKKVMLANSLGERWLGMPGNPLCAGSSDARQIGALLQDACGANGPRKASGSQLRKPNGARYFVTAIPMPAQSASLWHSATPAALLLVNDMEQGRQPAGELLKQIFHLTPAEIRLVHPLLQGEAFQEAVVNLNISVETGRTHLKSVFSKLGIRRQTELHRLLGRMDLAE